MIRKQSHGFVALFFYWLFSQRLLFSTIESARALSTSLCWMVRGTAPLSADVRPSLLSLAERGLGTPVLPQESAQFPSPSLTEF